MTSWSYRTLWTLGHCSVSRTAGGRRKRTSAAESAAGGHVNHMPPTITGIDLGCVGRSSAHLTARTDPGRQIAQQERPDGHRRLVPGAAPSGNGSRRQVRMAPLSEFDNGGTRESPRKDRTGDPRSASPSAPLAEQPSLRQFASESHTIVRRSYARDHPSSGARRPRTGPAGPAKQLAMEDTSRYAAISSTPAKRCLRAAPADRDIASIPFRRNLATTTGRERHSVW